MRIFAFLLMAVGVLGLVFSMRAMFFTPQPARPAQLASQPVMKSRIIVLDKNMKRWDLIQPDCLNSLEVETAKKPAEALEDSIQNREVLSGKRLSHDKKAADALTLNDVMLTGDAEVIPLQLGEGHVAISVKLGAGSSILNLIKPGETVGLMVSVRFLASTDHTTPRFTSMWVIDAARVIAVGSRAARTAENALIADSADKTITVEVTPEQARKILIASRMGEINVAIRADAPSTSMRNAMTGSVPPPQSDARASHARDQNSEELLLQDPIYKEDKKRVMRIVSGNESIKEYSW
ncbi:hypothetical protein CGLAMM_05630 [Acetobacteraceae bacterium EV16G]|uniref:Flp pilus assembly protein RcpC/CpaB domain-containing protein n=2 Tax=Sorlinia euscelidii TaxID=3081148 RepID=A0ABU7TZY8_9PROT